MTILGETFLLDAFAVRARDIAVADVTMLVALSVSVGWVHRPDDWALMRELGQGRVAMDEVGRVHGAAMWFPFGDRHATIGMLITTPRLQANGGGLWLMRHVMAATRGRMLGLHATRQSHRLFRSLGFADEGIVCPYQGQVGMPPELPPLRDAAVRALLPSDLAAIQALDRAATGWDRRTLIDALVARSRGMVLIRDGRVAACALMRPFGRGTLIGPVIAAGDGDALHVVRPLMIDRVGRFVRIDTWDDAGGLVAFVKRCGLSPDISVTRMSHGEPWPFATPGRPSQMALPSQATG